MTARERLLEELPRASFAITCRMLGRVSNGQGEGHVHRLKVVKRTMLGCAGFALLRKRVLRAA